MPILTLYTRAGCHLCEQARAILTPICREHGLSLHLTDIDADPALVARYGERIPVAALDGDEMLAWPFTRDQARRTLAASLGA